MSEEKKSPETYEEFIDIMSSSTPSATIYDRPKKQQSAPAPRNAGAKVVKGVKETVERYGDGMFKYMGGIVKFIAFVICFSIIIVSLAIAFFLYSQAKFDIVISIAVIAVGTAVSLINLFIIYSIGHIVNQNNLILSRLNRLLKRDDDR